MVDAERAAGDNFPRAGDGGRHDWIIDPARGCDDVAKSSTTQSNEIVSQQIAHRVLTRQHWDNNGIGES
jgi:hypothetical protein